jgi:DNA modification methylase
MKLSQYLPKDIGELGNNQSDLPRLAKDIRSVKSIESAVQQIPTSHELILGDSREVIIPSASVHLVVTSPPYWTLKNYPVLKGQMGLISEFDTFMDELERVWKICYQALVPGGRLVCVVGDVCLSRRKNAGRHIVMPLHAAIQERCRHIGFDNLAPIIWYKIANASYEVEGGSRFLGKPYEPNSIIKNDIEFILMQRKPGGYRHPSKSARVLSLVSEENHRNWFQQIWTGITGASTRNHPAPFPLELAERLVRMFSFVGDTVLDPFMGTGTTNLAAARWGRNSIGVEIEPEYFDMSHQRLEDHSANMFRISTIQVVSSELKLA